MVSRRVTSRRRRIRAGSEAGLTSTAEAWVATSVPIVGGLELVQTEPWASVYRATAPDGEIVWFKACAPHQAFEVPLTASLSARWPTTVTDVLAHDVDRRWLLMADAGETFRKLGNPPERWLEVLPAYAQMQAGETDRVGDHLDAGVPDLRLTKLPERYDDLLAAELPLAARRAGGPSRRFVPASRTCAQSSTATASSPRCNMTISI